MTLISVSSHFSANACLAPICSLHHVAVTTVEGIGSTKSRLHPVQVTGGEGGSCQGSELLWPVGLSVAAWAVVALRPGHLPISSGGCEAERRGAQT